MYGIIYCAQNTVNGKRYIGQTIRPLEKRKYFHYYEADAGKLDYHFYRAIRQYGKDSFEWKVIEEVDTLEALIEREKYWIEFYQATDPLLGYNMTLGGEGFGAPTDEVRLNMGRNMEGEANPFYGKCHSEDSKRRMSEFQKTRPRAPHSEATRKKMSEARKKYWASRD